MKTMKVDLDEITGQHKKFNLLASTDATELEAPDDRETSSNIYAQIFGRTEERDSILATLSKIMTKEITIFPIYGIGGLGKTTLAQMVYNSSQFKDYSRVWVYVSQTFELKKIGNSIISQLSQKEIHYTEMQMIDNSLSKLFDDKKILIVLDDLWEDKKINLDRLKGMLNVGSGSNVVVIVTTRTEGIAMEICTIKPHKLLLLSNGMCWSIIKHKSGFKSRDDKNELKQIGKDIASKCGGLCFAYCAIFPKGHNIVKDGLIQQWLALAFIEPTDVYSSWDLGKIYIRQLLGLSFLQISESSLVAGVHLEDATLFTMHDLVHDLARAVMFDEIIVADKERNNGGSCGRYALLNDCSKPVKSSKISALRFMDCHEIELDGAAFSSAKSLRVLDLSECSIHKLPDSIGVLKQLRYLNAPRIRDTMVPDSISRLSKLIYLNLHGSATLLELPKLIGDIGGLVYLNLSCCSRIEKLPESLVRLKSLVHLDLSNCSCVRGVSDLLGNFIGLQYLNLSYCQNIGELPANLGGLSELRYLNLSFSSYLQHCQAAENFGSLTKLEYLNLSSERCDLQKLPEALSQFVQLKYLNLSGCQHMTELPRLFGDLKKLMHLDLSKCVKVKGVPEALDGLTKLKYLNLSRSYDMLLRKDYEDVGCLIGLLEVIGNLKELCYLNLSGCMIFMFETHCRDPSGFDIDSLMYCISTLSNLEHVDLSHNSCIRSIAAGSLSNLRKLHTLDFSYCLDLYEISECIGTIDSLKIMYLTGCPVK